MQCEQRFNYGLRQHLYAKTPSLRLVRPRERRKEVRSTHSFPARVWGVDINDEPFALDCTLENISASGLYLKTPWQLKSFSEISLVVRLMSGPNEGASAAIKGRVIRDKPVAAGQRGIAVEITEYCFL